MDYGTIWILLTWFISDGHWHNICLLLWRLWREQRFNETLLHVSWADGIYWGQPQANLGIATRTKWTRTKLERTHIVNSENAKFLMNVSLNKGVLVASRSLTFLLGGEKVLYPVVATYFKIHLRRDRTQTFFYIFHSVVSLNFNQYV